MQIAKLILKNIARNPLRTLLTSMGTMVLVLVVTLIWSVLSFLQAATADKAENFKAIVTERWQIPSQMPFAYASTLSEGAARDAKDIRPKDSMTWQFFGGAIDPNDRKPDNFVFAFGMEPDKLLTMMDELDSLQGQAKVEFQAVVEKLKKTKQGIILGKERLQRLNKKVGERLTLYGLNYRDINLEFEVVGLFPSGRYDLSAAINRDYLNDALDEYPRKNNGKKHPMTQKTLNLVWLKVDDKKQFEQLGAQILNSPNYTSPAVKIETASSGVGNFLEAYKDFIWAIRYILAPAILVILSLVIANAISISVRERRKEMAVLKVLGFVPRQILGLVLGEAVFVGVVSGLVSSGGAYWLINNVAGGIKFPIAFFSSFFIPQAAIWWGVGIGLLTSFAGSIIPAWSARSVKVADVFAKAA